MPACMTVAVKEIRDHLRDARSLRAGAAFALMGPAVIVAISFSEVARNGGPLVLLSMMSVFTLVSTFSGGMYLALDATAGERERGSFVPLLLNPVSRLHLIAGKWIAVSVFSLAGLILNLVGFTLVFEWSGSVTAGDVTGVFLLWIVCGLIPLALLGAALDLAAAATCHSIKEAHSRLSMVMFLPMSVGMFLVFFPEWVGRWWYVVPVVGQQTLIGTGLRGGAVSVVHAVCLGLVTMALAIVTVAITARSLERRDTLVG
jgi:sodium transport system permease protein